MKLVSIVVPIYNVEKYLDECISSLINQNYKKIEIILVNDGSTDRSKKICQKYLKKDKRIKLINQKNSGHGPACNTGINNANGSYIFFCDGDDYLLENSIKHLVENIEDKNSNIAICTAYAFDNKSKINSIDPYHSLIRIPQLNSDDCLNNWEIIKYASQLSVRAWDKLYDLKWLKKNKIYFPNFKTYYDDVPFHWEVISKTIKLSILREQLYCYRLNRENASYYEINQKQFFEVRKTAMEIVKIHNKNLLNEFYISFIADISWIENIEKQIKLDFYEELNKALSNKKLTKETKDFIKNYFYRQSFEYKIKEKIKACLKILKS